MQGLNQAFLLAAGQGTRLQPFTNKMAKPAIPFWGLPTFLYPYFFLKDLGVESIAYNSHHRAESLKQSLKKFDLSLTELYEPELLNSAGGIANAASFLQSSENFLVLNADSLFIYDDLTPFKRALKNHQEQNRLATLFSVNKPGVGKDFPGLLFDEKNRLIQAGFKANRPGLNCSHFIGITIFSKKIFNHISTQPTNIIYDHLIKLSDQHKVHVAVLDWDWYELGKIPDYQKAHKEITEKLKSKAYNKDSSFVKSQRLFNKDWDYASFKPQGIELEILGFDSQEHS